MSVGKKSFKKKDYQALNLLRSTAIATNVGRFENVNFYQ